VCSDDDGNNTWQEMLKFIYEMASSGDPSNMEAALHILTYVT
jgi:hypothetical protein